MIKHESKWNFQLSEDEEMNSRLGAYEIKSQVRVLYHMWNNNN